MTKLDLSVALESFRQNIRDPSERVASHDIESLFGHLDKRDASGEAANLKEHRAVQAQVGATKRTVDAARTTSGFASTAGAAKANILTRFANVR